MALIDNASRLSVEITQEIATLTSIKKKLRDQLCRLQVEERALRELLVCETQPILQATDNTFLHLPKQSSSQQLINDDEPKSPDSDITPAPPTKISSCNAESILSADTKISSIINSQELNLDANTNLLCSYRKTLFSGEKSSSGKEELDTSCDEGTKTT